ncbi:hypothetical protein FRC17_004583 [Serendipita sp. 399]|nr:hypothetical protein FRC17_004583 [Serendipita sp. 399]
MANIPFSQDYAVSQPLQLVHDENDLQQPTDDHLHRIVASPSGPPVETYSMLDSSPRIPATSPPVVRAFQRKKGERSTVDMPALSHAFTVESPYPDTQRRAMLEEILASPFYLNNEHEPQLGTPEADFVLIMAGACSLANEVPRKGSLYSLLVKSDTKTCLICNKPCGVMARALGCVRKHLGHRPFVCRGEIDLCKQCTNSRPYHEAEKTGSVPISQMVSLPSVGFDVDDDDYILTSCYKNSNTRIRIGGMRRHYKSMHPSEQLPNLEAERRRAKEAAD